MKSAKFLILSALFVMGCGGTMTDTTGADQSALHEDPGVSPDVKPNGRGGGIVNHWAKGGSTHGKHSSSNGIDYHGGPVMTGTKNVYYIWYGNFSNTTQSLLTNLAQNIGGSAYFNINTTYHDGSNNAVSNSVSYAGSVADNYSRGKSLSDSDIQAIVASHFSKPSPNAVYFVLTSADVTETSGFCSAYCGWHTHGTVNGVDTKYAFIGDPNQCPSACAAQSPGPNGDLAADGMASIISHELEEAATDPDLNAWYDRRGYENADKCAWTFGTTSGSTGAKYNVTLGGTHYLIQQNWVNASGGYCAMSL